MASNSKQRTEGQAAPVDSLESRAWELFVANVPVGGVATHTPEHLAQECFKAAAKFEAVAEQHKEKG